MEFLEVELANNSLTNYLFTVGIILVAMLAALSLRFVLRRLAKKHRDSGRPIFGEAMSALSDGIIFLGFAVGQIFALDLLVFPPGIERFQEMTSDLLLVLAVARSCWYMVRVPEVWVDTMSAGSDSLNSMLGPMLRNSLKTAIIILTLLQCLQIISNQPLTTILAGLGVGAAALALASQQSVSNFFGSVVLFVNRPFEMGDRIVYNGNDGPIEEVGIMCTKQRTLEGHLVTIPNGKLGGDIIRNISKRPNIRQIHNITITYDTPPEKIERAVEILKELLDNHPGYDESMPPKVYFNSLNADSLNLFVIFWFHPPDWWAFNDFNESFLLNTFKRFGEEGIDFAFPTQTLYLAGDENRPLEFAIRKASETQDPPA